MKSKNDPRHIRRIKAIKALFAYSFYPGQPLDSDLAPEVVKSGTDIDQVITKCAPEWPLSQINRLDLSVLRLAVYELMFHKDTPPKVIIDEAVEIGKQFGSASSGSFINGVLASALKATDRDKDIKEETPQPAETSESQSTQ